MPPHSVGHVWAEVSNGTDWKQVPFANCTELFREKQIEIQPEDESLWNSERAYCLDTNSAEIKTSLFKDQGIESDSSLKLYFLKCTTIPWLKRFALGIDCLSDEEFSTW